MSIVTYEERMDANPDWAIREGSMHFEEGNHVHRALQKITQRLDDLHVAYAVVGGMAMFQHGFRRFTEDVDLLVTPETLKLIHEKLEGLGYVAPFQGSKHLRDAEFGVRIEFLTTGAYPGDGKPKPVAFPDPAESSIMVRGFRCLTLPKLVELKLASGMTGAGRRKDISDVQELIRSLKLPRDFALQLNPYVHETYFELWDELLNAPTEI